METDAAAAAPQKKKKVKRTDAEVNARGSSLPLQELEAYINQENHMRAKDKLSEDTKQARNDLEGYILSARSKLYAEWEAFVAEDARASFSKTLEDSEEWMYEDGEDETREVYVAKMRELQGVGDPIQERCAEDRSRGRLAPAFGIPAPVARLWPTLTRRSTPTSPQRTVPRLRPSATAP
jgi:heat shock protein 4